MSITRIVNKKQTKEYDILCMRPSILGNPWSHLENSTANFIVKTRKEAYENHRAWLYGVKFTDVLQEQRKEILKILPTLKGKVLACCCYPLLCHVQNYIDLLEGNPY